MTFEQLTESVINKLQESNIQYMLTGALAVNYYGIPRMTHDIDIIIQMTSRDIIKIREGFDRDFFVGEESISNALCETSMFNMIHKESGFKVDFWILKNDEYNKNAFERRRASPYQKIKIFLPTPEDVIIIKLEWFKQADIDKHYSDAAGIYRIQKDNLDKSYINKWCDKKSLSSLWQKIQSETVQ